MKHLTLSQFSTVNELNIAKINMFEKDLVEISNLLTAFINKGRNDFITPDDLSMLMSVSTSINNYKIKKTAKEKTVLKNITLSHFVSPDDLYNAKVFMLENKLKDIEEISTQITEKGFEDFITPEDLDLLNDIVININDYKKG